MNSSDTPYVRPKRIQLNHHTGKSSYSLELTRHSVLGTSLPTTAAPASCASTGSLEFLGIEFTAEREERERGNLAVLENMDRGTYSGGHRWSTGYSVQ